MYGTVINVLAIIVGSIVGVLLKNRFNKKTQLIVFQALGLTILLVGIQMALKVQNITILILSVLIGAIIGESINIGLRIECFGIWLKNKIKLNDVKFTDAFVAASVLFCVGAMSIIGSLDEGIRGDKTVLITKSVIEGFAAIALASSMGIGTAFSVIPIFFYQGSITVLSGYVQSFFTPYMISQLTAVGGVLIMGVSIDLLDIKKIKIMNMLPSLIIVVLLSLFFK